MAGAADRKTARSAVTNFECMTMLKLNSRNSKISQFIVTASYTQRRLAFDSNNESKFELRKQLLNLTARPVTEKNFVSIDHRTVGQPVTTGSKAYTITSATDPAS